MFFLFSPLSCTVYCSFSTKSFLLVYKYVCYFLVPLVLNFLPTTLLLFCTHSRPSKPASSCSFTPIHSSLYLTSLSLLLRNCLVKDSSDFRGANSMAYSLLLPHVTSVAPNTEDTLFEIAFLAFHSPGFLSVSVLFNVIS